MNAARDTDPIEVRGNLSRGDRVLARTRRAGAIGGGNWHPGRVDKVAARGVFVIIDHGGQDFYRWADVRRDPERSVVRRPRPVDDALPEDGPLPEPAPPRSAAPPEPAVSLEGLLDDAETIAEVFARWRERAGLSQEKAARRMNFGQTYYSCVERGARIPTDDQLIAFAQATGLDLVELIDIRAKGPGKTSRADEIDYVDLPPEQAWKVLGLSSVHALWSRLRRDEEGGQVDLGGGHMAYRRGPRRWLVRFPRNNAAAALVDADEPSVEERPPEPELSTKPSNFLKWSEGLQHYVPVPSDPDLRRRWFEVVRDLFEIWKKDQR